MKHQTCIKQLSRMLKGRMPGQLVIQITDQCNATCPQCGMRRTNAYPRTRLTTDEIKEIIDAAAAKGIQALSFTGGEPMLLRKDLPGLIRHAGRAGIPYIRTGTNGFCFAGHDRPGFMDRMAAIAGELSNTPLRNFWISLDSAVPAIHESMRGFKGVVKGLEKALPLFHRAGLFPSANLGLNRNITPGTRDLALPDRHSPADPAASLFYRTFARGLETFYRTIINLGFTIVNACYPMSMADSPDKGGLNPVYAAASPDRVVCFTPWEKALLFKALLDTIPRFRSKIRIFSPLTTLYTLYRTYSGNRTEAFPCRGGIDFFYVNCIDGHTYPCGYRGNDDLGKFQDLDLDRLDSLPTCLACDWECFRDPSELGGPVMEGLFTPWRLAARMAKDPGYGKYWLSDLGYYRACRLFDGRTPPDASAMARY